MKTTMDSQLLLILTVEAVPNTDLYTLRYADMLK
jgi:hypothetical protein